MAGGVRVTEISAERRSLEEVVLSVTSSGSDRVDSPPRGGSPAHRDDGEVLEQGNMAGREQP